MSSGSYVGRTRQALQALSLEVSNGGSRNAEPMGDLALL
jgi:hypothetical protein